MNKKDLRKEWLYQQGQFDSYEKYSLVLKLVSITLCCWVLIAAQSQIVWPFVFVLLWGQDAIWKTFQGRIEYRLLTLEQALAHEEDETSVSAFQYNTVYAQSRSGLLGLLKEYASQACRPTIAFPHALIVAIHIAAILGGSTSPFS